jgi:uncharacterized membrane protein
MLRDGDILDFELLLKGPCTGGDLREMCRGMIPCMTGVFWCGNGIGATARTPFNDLSSLIIIMVITIITSTIN